MAGINRLGKGPAKPGTMRPADPNKYKTSDFFSEGTEGDKDYQRMVQDIEDTQQNHTGWLFGRGAFDKGDLLYLRDEEEKKRYAEQELRETESRAFNSMRQKVMSQHADSLADTNPAHMQKLNERMAHAEALKSRIKVKPSANVKLKAESGMRIKQEGLPEKKVKREAIKSEHVKSESPDVRPGIVKNEPEGQAVGPINSLDAKDVSTQNGSEQADPDESDAEAPGLGGLLGDYGSESEEDTETKKSRQISAQLPLPDFFK